MNEAQVTVNQEEESAGSCSVSNLSFFTVFKQSNDSIIIKGNGVVKKEMCSFCLDCFELSYVFFCFLFFLS